MNQEHHAAPHREIAELAALDRERSRFAQISAILGWDQETYMPEAAVTERAEQLALVESLAHERAVNPKIGMLLAACEGRGDLAPQERAYLRVLRREYDRETKLPAEFVTEFAKAVSVSQAAWAKARQADDFPAFEPYLSHMVDLNRRKAAYLAPGAKAYDALLDLFEPGSTESSIAGVFAVLRKDLVALLAKIRARAQVDDAFLHARVPESAQRAMSELMMDLLGYDRRRGRLDATAHPFTTTLGPDDVRITTRYIEDYFPSSVFSTIHETGHALYELGIAPGREYRGTRLAEAASMAVHESQSRMLENMIGRSEAFWKPSWDRIAALAAPALDGVDLPRFVRAVNRVQPSLIRVEADEVTYALHVILRFEIESELISGRMRAKDMPAAWNEKMRDLLGVEVPDNRSGCLQDIHWSMGAFGYFPSYALGNLYAAQFLDAMRRDIPDLDARIASGSLAELRSWLGEKVHKPGATFLPAELVQDVTGSPLDASHFTRYLGEKYGRIYGF